MYFFCLLNLLIVFSVATLQQVHQLSYVYRAYLVVLTAKSELSTFPHPQVWKSIRRNAPTAKGLASKRLLQLALQSSTQGCNLLLMHSILLQQYRRVGVRGIHGVRVLDIEIKVPGFDLVDGHAPGIIVFDARRSRPPGFLQIKLRDV